MVNIDSKFWSGKRVLLTGHTGFKGSWLTLWLRRLGANVTGFALPPPTDPSLYHLAQLHEDSDSVIGDIRDAGLVSRTVANIQPEIVIHMAAQPLVRYSYAHPVETYHTNVLGTAHVLDAIRHVSSVKAVVNVTTDKCYENREWVWGYRENDALGGHDPYSNSKGCAELVTAAFRNSYFHPASYGRTHQVAIATARAGNVIGGGDWSEDRLIPDFFRAIRSGEPLRIRSPKSIRPWQHVLEPLAGYLLLAERLYLNGDAYSDAWNFGPNESDTQTVAWVVNRLSTRWGGGAHWEPDDTVTPHEAHYLKLDCSKARHRLGWYPKWTLEESLERIVSWHKAHENGENMREQTLLEIKDFENTEAT